MSLGARHAVHRQHMTSVRRADVGIVTLSSKRRSRESLYLPASRFQPSPWSVCYAGLAAVSSSSSILGTERRRRGRSKMFTRIGDKRNLCVINTQVLFVVGLIFIISVALAKLCSKELFPTRAGATNKSERVLPCHRVSAGGWTSLPSLTHLKPWSVQ